jgi:hypothetical protein
MWFGSHTLNILQINNAQKRHVGLFIFFLYPCVTGTRQDGYCFSCFGAQWQVLSQVRY